ncbi:transglutaminase-like domain-containing protein [Sphingomonas sp. RIT328]|uniref:transglutaminase-like domain-containing protein n=1 Tax=Sphingomonas sp. RIT328 TaxID=1470591 RepID=UPI00044725CC|nr:transglutaminase family protein [Sphingomonas sp. RIT328]EZP55361.1 Transglutaminase-like superfamily protein [Sphingomonas sp. RIT328]
MRLSIDVALDYAILGPPSDVLLQIEAAAMPDQRIVSESLTVWSDTPVVAARGEEGIGQRCWIRADGWLKAHYRAEVEVTRAPVDLASLPATPARALDGALIPYLLPSRYCQSDRLEGFVRRRFGGMGGGALATALADWVAESLDYRANTSSGETTAIDTFASRSGVCRDYAHLLVALARAGEIPARCVAAYAPGVDPPDFHAVAELWLDGAWRLVDATRMAPAETIARVCVGRDATDIAFMTVFGIAQFVNQTVRVTAA